MNRDGSAELIQQKPLVGCLTAVQTLACILRPCYGPSGLQKLLVTARGERVFTDCSAAILGALQLDHPAALLVREAARSHAEHSGDGAAFVVLLVAALLEQAEQLLRAGVQRSQLREAYAAAATHTQALMPSLVVRALGPLEDPFWALRSVLGTHVHGYADHLTRLLTRACWAALDLDGTFEPARVRVCTLPGGPPEESCLLPGLAVVGRACGQMQDVQGGAYVALLACDFGPATSHGDSTLRFSGCAELAGFEKGLEKLVEKHVGQLATAHINVLVVWGAVDPRMLVQANRHHIMVIQASSRHDMVHLSQALGTPLMPCLVPPPRPGVCQRVYQLGLGHSTVAVLEWELPEVPMLTLVLRGRTQDGMRNAEQAARQAIQAYKELSHDSRLLPGAGATEMALAQALTEKGRALPGPIGPAFLSFAAALRSLPEALAHNSGADESQVMAALHTAQQAGNYLAGVGSEGPINAAQEGVWDVMVTKVQGLRVVTDLTLQLVTIDEIVLAKTLPQQRLKWDPNSQAEQQPSPTSAGEKRPHKETQ